MAEATPEQHSPLANPDTDADDGSKRTQEAKTAFLASLNSVGSSADAGLQARASDIASNSTQLSKQQAELEKSTTALAKETAQYQKIADDARGKLKEIGDVQNWAEVIERELLVLEETMRIVEEEEAKTGEGDEDGEWEDEPEPEAEVKDKGKKKKRSWW